MDEVSVHSPKAMFTVRRLVVGLGLRRHFMAWFNEMRAAGMDVQVWASKGLIETTYSVRITGSEKQIRSVAKVFQQTTSQFDSDQHAGP